MTNFRLYAWGANSHGQLGLGFQSEQCLLPCEVNLSSVDLEAKDVKKITGGAGHTLILDKKGRVYACGWNESGQAGIGKISKSLLEFEQVKSLKSKQVADIACGWNSSMALTKNGELFCWGSNSFGQLGTNEREKNYPEPWYVHYFGSQIKSIAMGLRHSAVVTKSGRIFTAGFGKKGQLGITDDVKSMKNAIIFTEVPADLDISNIACGQNHTVALGSDGKMYTWGDNKYGQTGNDKETAGTDFPVPLSDTNYKQFEKNSKVFAGWTHTCVLSEKKVITWGRNTYGELGYLSKNDFMSAPRSVTSELKFCQLAVGSEHNVAIADDGKIYSWGWNEHGNCGDGSTTNIIEPKRVEIPKYREGVLVGTGAGHSFAIVASENGKIPERSCK